MLFVEDDIDDDTHDDERHATKLDSIEVIPSHEVTQDKNDGADNHQNDSNTLKKTFHVAIAFY